MSQAKRDDINDRYSQVISERGLYPDRQCPQYKELSHIAAMINSELLLGNKLRHVMFMKGSHYDYRVE